MQGWLTTLQHFTTICGNAMYAGLQHIHALLQCRCDARWRWKSRHFWVWICLNMFECVWIHKLWPFFPISRCGKRYLAVSARDQWLINASQNGSACATCAIQSHGACRRWFPWAARTSSWCSFRLLELANLGADVESKGDSFHLVKHRAQEVMWVKTW